MQEKSAEKSGLWNKLTHKLSVKPIATEKLDAAYFDMLEEQLILSDLGAPFAIRLVANLRKQKFPAENASHAVQNALQAELMKILQPIQQANPFPLSQDKMPADKLPQPYVILVAGVNGSGKTTAIAKLANFLMARHYSVGLVAGDTFRTGASEQLNIWAKRIDAQFFSKENTEAAALAYQTIEQILAEPTSAPDVLIMDTAGRLHNQQDLMGELQKIIRVIQKLLPDAPHQTLLVLDATTGQNALRQAEEFHQYTPVSGFIINKMDGTAKGGMIPAIMQKIERPVYFLGMGEHIDDWLEFDAQTYADLLFNLQT